MSILTYPLGFIGGGGEALFSYNGVMENCLRLDDDSSAYMHRTPATVSDTRTYTVSCWLKRANNFGGYDGIFSAYGASNSYRHHFQFWSTAVLRVAGKNGGGSF